MKILVKMPFSSDEYIKSFPFIHALRQEYHKAQIYLITDDQNKMLANFLVPLAVESYTLPECERSILKLHRYAANLTEVFNINLYFDLEGTKASASLGKFFRVEKSIGPDRGLIKLLYDHAYTDRDALFLLESFVDKSFTSQKVRGGVSHPIKDVLDLPDYFVLFPLHLDIPEIATMWESFINTFEDKTFVIWRNSTDDLVTPFADKLKKHNDVRVLLDDSLSKTEQFLINAKAVFSDEKWPLLLSSYLALDNFYLTQPGEPAIRTPWFHSSPRLIEWQKNGHHIIDGHETSDYIAKLEEILHL